MIVEAVQWTGLNRVEGVTVFHFECADGEEHAPHGRIETLEGPVYASVGDWIITGINGERYACKPDVFAMTYEPVDAPEPRR